MSTEKMVKSIGLQASPFIAKKVIKALLGISDQSPDGGAPGFLRHPVSLVINLMIKTEGKFF